MLEGPANLTQLLMIWLDWKAAFNIISRNQKEVPKISAPISPLIWGRGEVGRQETETVTTVGNVYNYALPPLANNVRMQGLLKFHL